MSTSISPQSIQMMRTWLGFTELETPVHLYALLGVRIFERDRQRLEIGLRYRMEQLQMRLAGPEGEACMQVINLMNKAFAVLQDPQRQAAYDRRLIDRQLHRALSEFDEYRQLLTDSGVFAIGSPRPQSQPAAKSASVPPARRAPAAVPARVRVPMWLRALFFLSGPVCGILLALWAAPHVKSYLNPEPAKKPAPVAKREKIEIPRQPVVPPTKPTQPNSNSTPNNVVAPPAQNSFTPPKIPQMSDASSLPTSPTVNSSTASRLPAPTGTALAEAEALFDELYGDQRKAAKEDQALSRQLAQQWIQLARQTMDDPNSTFVLYQHALAMALDSGSPMQVEIAASELLKRYELDEQKLKLPVINQIAGSPDSECADLGLQFSYDLMERAIADDDYSLRQQLTVDVGRIVAQTADPDTRMIAQINLRRLDKYAEQSVAANQARSALNDPGQATTANQTLGEWLCFYKNDWTAGISHLASGTDPQLKQAAETESATRTGDVQGVETSAGLWWSASQSRGDEWEQLAIEHHAVELYQKILPQLSGLKREAATKRIAAHEEKLPR
ncbi:hypothetical protein LOC68_02290 [Blastopirellula sp. JC732]|uniref:Uncharacterized protein n=1 Tax=Blastopirellula sediminis TaxID=2894196 RepID=A0A9X1MJ24_9BACT|nr:hypothetical protein [Blastopirellula sediminis]MCC9607980.1 hypothetical protein [Blastopirellula sediminis]MCC9627227.1 hypothetical protein [Blastopirellula sediminis]